MLNRSATFLRIRKGSILDLAKSVVALRTFCQEPPWQSGKREPRAECYVPKQYTVEDFKHLLKTEEDAKKCRSILLEIRSLREETGQAPDEILESDIEGLLSRETDKRHRYYSYMIKREMTERNQNSNENVAGKAEDQDIREPEELSDTLYSFLKEQNQFKSLEGRRLMEAAGFGQKVFFDLGFNDNMLPREQHEVAEQIHFAYSINKDHPRPFDLNVCNIDKNSDQTELLGQYLATEDPETLLIGTTEKSYLDLCPKEELIYLSPDSPNPLGEWDHSATFIIGGIVDRSRDKPLTLAKAKKEGIRCARLPIREHVLLKASAQKSLTLDAVLDILLTMKETNDWRIAFKKLPTGSVVSLGRRELPPRLRSNADLIRILSNQEI